MVLVINHMKDEKIMCPGGYNQMTGNSAASKGALVLTSFLQTDRQLQLKVFHFCHGIRLDLKTAN